MSKVAKRKVIEGYCPKGFEKNFEWMTKKNPWGKMTTFFWMYLTKDTPLKDKEGFIKVRITIQELELPKPKGGR